MLEQKNLNFLTIQKMLDLDILHQEDKMKEIKEATIELAFKNQ